MCTVTTRLCQLEDVAEYRSFGREITISAQRESRPSHEKHDPQDKENGRELNEREMKMRRKERNRNGKILVKGKDKLQMMDKVWKRK